MDLLNPDEVQIERGVIARVHHDEGRRLAARLIGDIRQ